MSLLCVKTSPLGKVKLKVFSVSSPLNCKYDPPMITLNSFAHLLSFICGFSYFKTASRSFGVNAKPVVKNSGNKTSPAPSLFCCATLFYKLKKLY